MKVWISVKPIGAIGYDVPAQYVVATRAACELMFAPSLGYIAVPVEVPDHPDQPKADEVQRELSTIIG